MRLFHTTKAQNIKSIIGNGLIVEKSRDGLIYFGEDLYTANVFQWMDHCSHFSIIEFELSKKTFHIKQSFDHNEQLLKERYPEIKKCYFTDRDIPQEYIVNIFCYDYDSQKEKIVLRNRKDLSPIEVEEFEAAQDEPTISIDDIRSLLPPLAHYQA